MGGGKRLPPEPLPAGKTVVGRNEKGASK